MGAAVGCANPASIPPKRDPPKKREPHRGPHPAIEMWVDPPGTVPIGGAVGEASTYRSHSVVVAEHHAAAGVYVDPNEAFFSAIITKEKVDTITFLKSLEMTQSDRDAVAVFNKGAHATGLMKLFMPNTATPTSDEIDVQLGELTKDHPDASSGASVLRRLMKAYSHGDRLSDEVDARESGQLALRTLVLSSDVKSPYSTKVLRSDGDVTSVPISDKLYEQSMTFPRSIYAWAPGSYPPHIATLPKAETYGEAAMFGPLGLYLRLMVPRPKQRGERYTAIDQFPLRGFAVTAGEAGWSDDVWFGRQRIAGVNPGVIRRIADIPTGWAELMREQYPPQVADMMITQWRMTAAKKKLYMVRYSGFNALRRSRMVAGQQVYLPDPTILLEQTDRIVNYGEMQPLAIQVEPSADYNRIYLPPMSGASSEDYRNPWAWRWAKMCVGCAEWNHMEVVSHLTYTHLVEEVLLIGTHRALHPSHPIHHLLMPHFERTLSLNDAARRILIPVYLEYMSSLGAAGVMELAGKAYSDFDFQQMYVPRDLYNRDTADLETHGYFYGVDAKKIWQTLAVYCHKVVHDIYDSDAELANDLQIQRWCDEICQAGRLKGFPTSFSVRTALVEALTMIIFTASAQHSAINQNQGHFLSTMPNTPGALLAGPPSNGAFTSTDFQQLIIDSLPDSNMDRTQAVVLRILSQPAPDSDTLAAFKHDTHCKIIKEHAADLVEDLKPIQAEIMARDVSNGDADAYHALAPQRLAVSIRI